MSKKKIQLGMNPSTASHRLRTDILFKFVTDAGHLCYQCGGELRREDFSIEHKKPWLDSDDPVRNFFDLDNIVYSHLGCNSGASRVPNKIVLPEDKSWCSNCKRFRNLKYFPPKIRKSGGGYRFCTECSTASYREYKKRTIDN